MHGIIVTWAHGGVETANCHILRVLRSVLSEFRLSSKDWPILIYLITYLLNNAIPPSLKFAPIELFSGRDPSSPIDLVWNTVRKVNLRLNCTSDEIISYVESMRQLLANMHRQVTDIRMENVRRTNRRREGPVPNFTVGDFV